MTMHLLPAYWTTTNSKKRKKKKKLSASQQESIRQHEKYLAKMGIDPNYVRVPTPLKLDRPSKQLPQKSIQEMDWSPCPKRNVPTLSGDYVVGQAYNKGNYQVLSSQEVADEDTGKRRV